MKNMEVIKITLDGGRKVTAHLNDGRQVKTDQPVAEGGTDQRQLRSTFFWRRWQRVPAYM